MAVPVLLWIEAILQVKHEQKLYAPTKTQYIWNISPQVMEPDFPWIIV